MSRKEASRALALGVAALGLALVTGSPASAGPTPAGTGDHGRLLAAPPGQHAIAAAREQIGTSVQKRPIYAYQLGDPKAAVTAVVLGEMHGDEPAGVRVAHAVVNGPTVFHVDLWVVPTMNPDGLAAHTRQNAHGVDLNRNWSNHWVHETGRYDSGPHPFSEPETRAMRDFLKEVDPDFVVSLHQPLHGVDSDHPKNPRLMHRLSIQLNLPTKPFTCGGVCHGTMTGWFNAHRDGACITVEFGAHPARSYLMHKARTGTVVAVLGHYH